MSRIGLIGLAACLLALLVMPLSAQEAEPGNTAPETVSSPESATGSEGGEPNLGESVKEVASDLADRAGEIPEQVNQKIDEVAAKLNESEKAKEISAGILQPIYQLGEFLAHPAFYWLAFTFMMIGVVSFALQLVLGKLIVLTRLGFSLGEIFSDAAGLVISLIGIVLATQAATENSSFTSSPFAVISATVVGAVVGFVLYLKGQSQEIQAARGRQAAAEAAAKGEA